MDRLLPHSAVLICGRQALFLLTTTLARSRLASAAPLGPFAGDLRLRSSLTVRVSRMPLSELFQRIELVAGVRLVAEGEDVADQKIDLFVRHLPVDEILTAIPNLLNAEGPRGYRWERSGHGPEYRYVLVRDLASREWEQQHVDEAERRMARLLRERLATVGSEPFRPDPARRLELPAMRKLLSTLSDDQVERLLTERILALPAITAGPGQRPVLKELIDQAVSGAVERRPDQARQIMAMWGPPEKDISAGAFVYLEGDPPDGCRRPSRARGGRRPVPITRRCGIDLASWRSTLRWQAPRLSSEMGRSPPRRRVSRASC